MGCVSTAPGRCLCLEPPVQGAAFERELLLPFVMTENERWHGRCMMQCDRVTSLLPVSIREPGWWKEPV